MIKAIIFDIDGVLIDSKKANVALFQNIFQKAGYPKPSKESVEACFHMPALQAIEKLTGSKDKNEIRRVWEFIKDSNNHRPDLFKYPDGLEDILDYLSKHYKLGIVTSRTEFGVDMVFRNRDIRHYFDVVVNFEHYKNPKPHPEPLLIALKRLNISANEAIYIGDSHTDIDAAKAAGMKSIYLSSNQHDDATIHISHFGEILSAVSTITST